MPTIISDETIDQLGDVFHAWDIPEYEKHERPKRWYIFMIVLAIVFILFGVFSNNFLFSLIIFLAGIILFMQSRQEPLIIPFMIAEFGIVVGNRFYPYEELVDFYFYYDPPAAKMLYIDTAQVMRPLLRIPLQDENPVDIQQTLRAFLPENYEKEESFADTLAREWRIH